MSRISDGMLSDSFKRLTTISVSSKHEASWLHLLHLSIDFSGSVIGAGFSRRKVRAHMGGPDLSLVSSPSSLTPRGSHPWRTGIKFNCLAVAFGRVRNLRAAVSPGFCLLLAIAWRHVTFLLVAYLVKRGEWKHARWRRERGRKGPARM